MAMRLLLAILALTAFAGPAAAATTDWQQLSPGVRLRLVSADTLSPTGDTMVGLELDMPPTYKTYWRVPGETGIPTEIDWGGSVGVKSAKTFWPVPVIEVADGLTDFVYHGATVLPVRLSLDGTEADLRATVTMGICSDICVPAQTQFRLTLGFAQPDRGQGLRLAQAMAFTPIPWPAAEPPFGEIVLDLRLGQLQVPLLSPDIDPASLLVDPRPSDMLFGAPQKSPEGNLVVLPLLGPTSGADLAGAPIELTFQTPDGPYSVSTRIAAVSTAGAP